MKRMHLRIPSLLLALLLLLWTLPASAQTPEELKAALMAEFSALTQQEKIAELEKQILDLKLQQAQLTGETRAIAAPCTEEPFLSQFIGRKGPFHDVDIVTGATFTSNAVINAVNSLFD